MAKGERMANEREKQIAGVAARMLHDPDCSDIHFANGCSAHGLSKHEREVVLATIKVMRDHI